MDGQKILDAGDHGLNLLPRELIEFPMSGFVADVCPRFKLSGHRLLEHVRLFECDDERCES
jgi:hypothetical protein